MVNRKGNQGCGQGGSRGSGTSLSHLDPSLFQYLERPHSAILITDQTAFGDLERPPPLLLKTLATPLVMDLILLKTDILHALKQ